MPHSCYIICKNEERCIGRCLSSIVNVFDEIVIVDTGSHDETINIINSFSKNHEWINVYRIKWNNDFSEARNFALNKCSYDTIMTIDADEYIKKDSIHSIISMLKEVNCNKVAYQLRIFNFGLDSEEVTIPRIFNKSGVFYEGYVHEQPILEDAITLKVSDEIVIIHDGYCDEVVTIKDKDRRNFILSKREFNKSRDIFSLYYYLRDMLIFKKFKDDYFEINEIVDTFKLYRHDILYKDAVTYFVKIIAIRKMSITVISEYDHSLYKYIKSNIFGNISICIITDRYTRNIEDTIELTNGIVDDICILDSSSDCVLTNKLNNTIDRRVKLFRYSWKNDFSKARNIISSKASNNVVMHIDSDESIKDVNELLDVIINVDTLKKIGMCRIVDTNTNIQYCVPRIYDKTKFKYFGRGHEEIREFNGKIVDYKNDTTKIDLVFIHDGYIVKDLFNNKMKRNLKNVDDYISINRTEKLNLRWMFFLARDSYNIGLYENIMYIKHAIFNTPSMYYNFGYLDAILSYVAKVEFIVNKKVDMKILNLMQNNSFDANYYNLFINSEEFIKNLQCKIKDILEIENCIYSAFANKNNAISLLIKFICDSVNEIENKSKVDK